MIRVVDESGEDYLHPVDYFAPIALSKTLVEALALAASLPGILKSSAQ
jgi:hypothetical protein